MSLSMQGSGREYWENSHMDMREHCSREQRAQRSVGREAERISDRRERPHDEGMTPELQSILTDGEFGRVDPTGWFPHYKNCVHHFVDYSQHTPPVLSVAAFINIRLPSQRPVEIAPAVQSTSVPFVSLRPYIRRLIVTAQDSPTVMNTFFGSDWEAGVGVIYKQERANYLFTAKSSGWAATKAAYDISPDEQTPFLRPLRDPSEEEIRVAEARWSEWLAMEDWMVGARSPW
ncbi:hypothetical protein PENANT_c017G09245 [Penicillium antarcticum]|uniref:Uncharacterized protein n=1 Tax=Penicillium antarcticum TaxID=416450 RepID=A0A1V6Q2S8_9EURO|nr:uncharacterized protein N7508_005431 [Penicillium antarcticum]KAJ5306416.1 hypothetical protein N7508_005431 [Penicillium antarcticum]OQD83347.1 hypothetical protein PENANT_c017G09245 [Penicillium antarcticum]